MSQTQNDSQIGHVCPPVAFGFQHSKSLRVKKCGNTQISKKSKTR